MRPHALGQPVRQASALTHEKGHASPQIVNSEQPVPPVKYFPLVSLTTLCLKKTDPYDIVISWNNFTEADR